VRVATHGGDFLVDGSLSSLAECGLFQVNKDAALASRGADLPDQYVIRADVAMKYARFDEKIMSWNRLFR